MSEWISLHIFYQGNLDDVITGCVGPMVSHLSNSISQLFFLRYWDGGPHLRLRLKPVDVAAIPELTSASILEINQFLRRTPSVSVLTFEDYLASAQGLAIPACLTAQFLLQDSTGEERPVVGWRI